MIEKKYIDQYITRSLEDKRFPFSGDWCYTFDYIFYMRLKFASTGHKIFLKPLKDYDIAVCFKVILLPHIHKYERDLVLLQEIKKALPSNTRSITETKQEADHINQHYAVLNQHFVTYTHDPEENERYKQELRSDPKIKRRGKIPNSFPPYEFQPPMK